MFVLLSKFEFSMKFKIDPKIMFQNIIDFEYYPNFMKQIQNVKIIKKSENKIITEETIILKSLIKKEIVQQTIHQIKENKIHSEIISGIAKNSIIDIILDGCKEETNVNVKIELKLGFKGRIFEPLIKKYLKMYVIGILRKINTRILEKS